MLEEIQLGPKQASDLLGDLQPLAEKIGTADGLSTLGLVAAALRLEHVDSYPALSRFLHAYQRDILKPLEWPSIQQAYQCAQNYQINELIALDQKVGRENLLQPFASASFRVGRSQLKKLRPLRDQRLVQRYLKAVESGHAHGCHTLVYGVILAVYSIPLRQGLAHYAQQTIRGFILAGAAPLQLTETQCQALMDEITPEIRPTEMDPSNRHHPFIQIL